MFLKTTLREEDDLDNLVDETQEVEEEERSRKESSKSNSSTYSSDSNVSMLCSVNSKQLYKSSSSISSNLIISCSAQQLPPCETQAKVLATTK